MKRGIVFLILLSCLHVFAGLEVVRILPNKINYKLNEDAVISVTVANRGGAKESAELIVYDKYDLDQKKVIAKIPVTLEAGSEKTFPVSWNTGTIRYGHESRAVLMQGSKVLSAKSEFFNIINEWWRVNIGVWASVIGGTPQGDRLCKWYGYKPYNTPFNRFFYKSWGKSPIGPFASYFTNWTPWNMSFSTYGVYHDPSFKDDEVWYAVAEGAEPRTYNDFKKETEFAKKWGVHRTKYISPTMTGNPGFELARKHPQWCVKDTKGDFVYYDPIDPIGLSRRPDKPYWAGWSHLRPISNRPEVVKYGIDMLLDSVSRHGYDGVYFDGLFMSAPGYDHEGNDLSKKYNFKEDNRTISDYVVGRFNEYRKSNPAFYHWANGFVNVTSTDGVHNIYGTPASGLLYEIGGMPMNPKIDYMNAWASLKEQLVKCRNGLWHQHKHINVQTNILHLGYTDFPDGLWMVKPSGVAWGRKGLQFENFKKSNQFWAINSHMAALMAAVCGHPYALCGAAYRPFSQVMTRYSKFYWHEDIRIVEKAYKKFSVDALRDIWWDDFVYTRDTPEYTDYYIHLLNAPDVKRLSLETVNETHAAKQVELATRLFKNIKKVQAWTIQPYGSTGDILEPIVNKIKPEAIDGETVFSIPDFRYYTLLVIREKK